MLSGEVHPEKVIMISLPEWLVVGVLSIICIIIWWGVRRLININDATHESSSDINTNLGNMNGRMGKMETRFESHEKQDDERHEDSDRNVRDLWKIVNKI